MQFAASRRDVLEVRVSSTKTPFKDWVYPEMPPIDRIRELAREIGYAIAVHGSLERDLDLIAAPWSEEALKRNYREVMQYIADGLGARLVQVEIKPLGRRGCIIQMNGYFKPIDLSVMPMKADPAYQLAGFTKSEETLTK